jgi:rhamnosyl/mannosyltransferase
MPTVTHVFKTYFPRTGGGLEEAVRQCGTYAAAKGFDVKVVCVGPADEQVMTPDGITARFYRQTLDFFSNPFSVSFARDFSNICRNTDLLHFHFPWPTAEMLTLAHTGKTKALVTFHCDIHRALFLKKLYLPFIRRFLQQMDQICVTSWALYDSTPYLRPFRRKITQIPLFMNEQRFQGLAPADGRMVERIRGLGPFALFVGVLRWYKGLDVLLDAAWKITGHVVIVGTGPLYDHLAARIERENLTHVHLLGFQEDKNLKWLIRQCRMIVLPSITPAEAFGQILLEGLYFKKPLISTKLGTGTTRVNRHRHTGLVVRPGCRRSLALAVNALFEDRDLAARFSRNSRYHYDTHFTPRVQGEKYMDIYRTLLQS